MVNMLHLKEWTRAPFSWDTMGPLFSRIWWGKKTKLTTPYNFKNDFGDLLYENNKRKYHIKEFKKKKEIANKKQ